MCHPAVVMGASALQGVLQIMGSQQQQKANIAYQVAEANARNTQIVQNRSMATTAYIEQVQAENTMKAQETQANAEQAKDLDIQRMKAEGTAKAAAADAGVDGKALDGMLFDFNRQEQMMLGRLDLNQQFADQARTSREAGYSATFSQRVQQIPQFLPSPVASVDYLSPILGIGKDALTLGKNTGYFNKPSTGDGGDSNSFLTGGFGKASSTESSTLDNWYGGGGFGKPSPSSSGGPFDLSA